VAATWIAAPMPYHQYQFVPGSVAGAMATPLYQRHIIA
jgi:hypothetical protein